ncbi:hypothetical protein ACFV5M_01830 [Streptomyces albidoflavus]
MNIPFDDEPDRRITPAVWEAFAAWYREKYPLDRSVHYEASHVEEVERLVREQVAKELGDRLTYGSRSWVVEDEPTLVDYQENSLLFEVWVLRGDDGEPIES